MVRNLLPSVDSLINHVGSICRCVRGRNRVARYRIAVVVFFVGIASLLGACSGGSTTYTFSVATGKLNDTGIDWCSENITTPGLWVNNVVCSTYNWAGNLWGQQQDAFFGRDAQAKAGVLVKVGGGMAGFDFTKIGASGNVLIKQDGAWSDSGTETAGTQWDCVRDNVTGLGWEVKRNDASHLRHKDHIYGWYNSSAATNGGNVGYETPLRDTNMHVVTGPTCTGVADVNKCNTQSYVTAVNAVGLCGKNDWRMPSVDELRSLVHMGRTSPAIDTDYFPNSGGGLFWTFSPNANGNTLAWVVSFDSGGYGSYTDVVNKSYGNSVLLVRSGH